MLRAFYVVSLFFDQAVDLNKAERFLSAKDAIDHATWMMQIRESEGKARVEFIIIKVSAHVMVPFKIAKESF